MSGSRLFALPKKVSGTNKLQPLMWQTNCSLADRILRKRGTASHVSRFVSTGNVIEGETLMLNGAVRLQVAAMAAGEGAGIRVFLRDIVLFACWLAFVLES